MNKNKAISVIVEEVVLISLYIIGFIQMRIPSIKMLAVMSIFFGLVLMTSLIDMF